MLNLVMRTYLWRRSRCSAASSWRYVADFRRQREPQRRSKRVFRSPQFLPLEGRRSRSWRKIGTADNLKMNAASFLGHFEGLSRTFTWNGHDRYLAADFFAKAKEGIHTDMTLMTTDKSISAHKLVVSACSEYLASIIDMSKCRNPVIVLKDVSGATMDLVMEYMYLGQVSVAEKDLKLFLELAKFLKIRGLTEDDIPQLDLASKIWENEAAATFLKFFLAKQIRDSVASQLISNMPPAILGSLNFSGEAPTIPGYDQQRLSSFTMTSESAELPATTEHNSPEPIDEAMSPRELGIVTDGENSEEEEIQDGSNEEKMLMKDASVANAEELLRRQAWINASMQNGYPFLLTSVQDQNTQDSAFDSGLWMQPNWAMSRTFEAAAADVLRLRSAPEQLPKVGPSGKPMVACDICGKKLSDPSSLYRHKKIHSGERPFKCPCCEKRFTQRYNMKQHLKLHITQQ